MNARPQTMIDAAMHTVKIRIVGDESRAETLMNMLHTMDGVAQVEEMPLTQAGLDANGSGDAVSDIEVAVADGATASRIRIFTAGAAILLDTSAEFVDRFGIERF